MVNVETLQFRAIGYISFDTNKILVTDPPNNLKALCQETQLILVAPSRGIIELHMKYSYLWWIMEKNLDNKPSCSENLTHIFSGEFIKLLYSYKTNYLEFIDFLCQLCNDLIRE